MNKSSDTHLNGEKERCVAADFLRKSCCYWRAEFPAATPPAKGFG